MSDITTIRELRPIDIYRDRTSTITEQEFRSKCAPQAIWHSIDLGDVFIEGSKKTSAVLAKENKILDWPDVRGKSVLDIGAFGGWFSFEAERRGAASVTAVDSHSWYYDWPKIHEWVTKERAAGRAPDTYAPPAWAIDKVSQPGRRAFDLTKEILGSQVKPVLVDVEDFESDPFDVVLYLGVLYHTPNPLYSLKKVAALTKDHLIVETLGVHLPGQEDRPLWEFFHSDQVNSDATTWWAPNDLGLRDMLLAAGFSRVELKYGARDQLNEDRLKRRYLTRLWAHAWK